MIICISILSKAQRLLLSRYSGFIEMFGREDSILLSHITQTSIGLTYKPTDISDDGIIVLRSGNIHDGKIDLSNIVRVSCPIKTGLLVSQGDILMCSRNGSASLVGKTAIIPEIEEDLSFGAFMTIIRSEYSEYLNAFFQTHLFRNQIKAGKSSTMNQITQKMLDSIRVPFPKNKNNQEEFAAFARQADKSEFDGFKSGFIEMFHSSETKKLGEIATYINGSAFKPEEWSETGLPIIRIQNLNDEYAKFNRYNGQMKKKIIINNGDVLISWSATLGVYLWTKGQALLNQHIFKVIFDRETVVRDFFMYAVKSKLDAMSEVTHGSTMKHIVKGDFENTLIPWPSLALQEEFAAFARQADKSELFQLKIA